MNFFRTPYFLQNIFGPFSLVFIFFSLKLYSSAHSLFKIFSENSDIFIQTPPSVYPVEDPLDSKISPFFKTVALISNELVNVPSKRDSPSQPHPSLEIRLKFNHGNEDYLLSVNN